MPKIKLFCLPYAGASAIVYSRWKKYLSSEIEICPVELAGRGRRFSSPNYSSMEEAVEDVYNSIKHNLDDVPYALFGHSMGSIIAFELYYRIKRLKHKGPVHIFFSGRGAPKNHSLDRKVIYHLPDDEFLKEVMEYGGMPEEFVGNRELLDIFMPVLRSDFKIIDTYNYIQGNEKIDCNITVLNGIEDNTIKGSINDWEDYISGTFQVVNFDGGHFFINNQEESVTNVINKVLL